ncbi:ATP-binding protein [Micrococcus sp. TA1]|uniref:ATP-binding protein n=1 Tax=Micrococcus sp. TA1 TaxID=681627 RepID=UPI0016149BAC|nr:ATP-binding protein [Micrococcus sp. TA1]MBB5750556.1 serine/threonine-protein kinase RsbW [Micrococcus sp. TA1]
MTDPVVTRSRRGPATSQTVEALQDDLEALWDDACHVAERERMAFTLAVVEAASNVVDHAVPSSPAGVHLSVELTISPDRLTAEIYEINAEPARIDLEESRRMDTLADSGRGLALMRTLLDTVVYERRDGTNVWVLSRTRAPHR